MLTNEFTLSVNEDNDGGTTPEIDHDYSRYDEYQNRSVYIGEGHSLSARDTIGFYRSFPKASGNFLGTAKPAVKITKDFTVAGIDSSTSLTVPAIVDIGFSLPVGLTAAQITALRMKAVALLSDDALMLPLMTQLQI